MKTSFIEPAILLNAFAMTLNIPLTAQYVYRRMWEETGNYTFASGSNVSECKQNRSDPIFAFREVRNENLLPYGQQGLETCSKPEACQG